MLLNLVNPCMPVPVSGVYPLHHTASVSEHLKDAGTRGLSAFKDGKGGPEPTVPSGLTLNLWPLVVRSTSCIKVISQEHPNIDAISAPLHVKRAESEATWAEGKLRLRNGERGKFPPSTVETKGAVECEPLKSNISLAVVPQ